MSQETKKMLAIIDKQHKEAYKEVKKHNRVESIKQKIDMAILKTLAMLGFVLMGIAILTF